MFPFKNLSRFMYNDGMDILPHGILASLTILYFFEVMISSSVYSYLPQLVKSFGTSEIQTDLSYIYKKILKEGFSNIDFLKYKNEKYKCLTSSFLEGQDAGMIAASLFVGRVFSSFLWGYIADKKDKKKGLIWASITLAASTVFFGFSHSYSWALIARFSQGLLLGVCIIAKTVITDFSNNTNTSLAFSIYFSAFTVGNALGPAIGAFLVFPAQQHPKVFGESKFFMKYPVFLPNLVLSIGLLILTAISVWIFPKTYKRLNINEDDRQFVGNFVPVIEYECEENFSLEIKTLSTTASMKDKFVASNFGHILLHRESLFSVILYGTYGIIGIGYWEVLPIFVASQKKFGGLAMRSSEIGLMMVLYNLLALGGLLFIVPRIVRMFGSKKTFVYCAIMFGCISPLIPVIGTVANKKGQMSLLVLSHALLETISSGCFVAANIFLRNSVKDDLQGTINGLAMSVSSLGRALGPAGFGAIYSWSLSNIEKKELGFPFNQYFIFFLVTIICFLNAAYVHFLIPKTLETQK